jgi:hypothetical protein
MFGIADITCIDHRDAGVGQAAQGCLGRGWTRPQRQGERGRADRDEQVMRFDLLMTIFPCLERRNYSCNEGTKW